MIQMITEEKDALVQYKSLCARFQIETNPVPEMLVKARIQVLENLINHPSLKGKV
jgi:hypothetical protein